MACRGVHFAIDQQTVDELLSLSIDQARLEFIQNDIEKDYFENHKTRLAETDKAWDWIHRACTNGKLEWSTDEDYPLNHLILGGQSLYEGDDYIISLKTPDQVRDVWQELSKITKETFQKQFAKIEATELEHTRQENFAYSWEWLSQLIKFWQKANSTRQYVLFTADQ